MLQDFDSLGKNAMVHSFQKSEDNHIKDLY